MLGSSVRFQIPHHARRGLKLKARIPPMPPPSRFARRFRLLTLLRGSLIAGALYDLFFAVLMTLAPEVAAHWFGLPLPPLPEGRFYLWLLAIFLGMLAALYLVAAHDPRRYTAVLVVAIVGRTLGAVAFVAAFRGTGLTGLLPLAGADLAFAFIHALCGWPLRS